MSIKPINKKHFTYVYNDDWKKGGIYWKLSPRSASAAMILQAYCDDKGYVCQTNGSGYTINELCDMFNMTYKTVKLVLTELTVGDVIVMDMYGKILLKHFEYNQGKRWSDVKGRNSQSSVSVQIQEARAENRQVSKDVKAIKEKLGVGE